MERNIIDPPSGLTKFVGKMTHRGEDEGDLLLVMADIDRLILKLGHQHEIARAIARDKTRKVRRELIAQDKDQVSDAACHARFLRGRAEAADRGFAGFRGRPVMESPDLRLSVLPGDRLRFRPVAFVPPLRMERVATAVWTIDKG
jgi:hypothetical protein